ncbi:hypothetical protein C7M61_003423 [Candidozyma pseudohaemuli]|uniref:Uncharacterized protein n=1 Tax=Candidozyma pseudohaemuli TaxID=418784 RepID=A0A2P7YP20_9ASCO|nr:hypothetical protein C7M61_003423 [[Candida] pseudohaemulonii]PSK37715.1 hypothetical protein C7M61_003423 [[Candida] pseudohaemulonii]
MVEPSTRPVTQGIFSSVGPSTEYKYVAVRVSGLPEVCLAREVMESLQRVISPGAKLPITKRLKTVADFAEWYFQFTQWVYSLDACVDHFLGGLINRGKADETVKGYYVNCTDEELKQLTARIHCVLHHVITESVGGAALVDTDRNSDIPHIMQLIIRYGYSSPYAKNVAELRSYAKSSKGSHNYRRHKSIYGSTDWKLKTIAKCINPAKYTDLQLVELLKHIDESNIDAQHEAALASGIANNYFSMSCIHACMWQMIKYKLDIKKHDKNQSRKGRKSDQKKSCTT